MIKSFFCSLFIAIFFLQPVLAMECKMDDWHKRRIYDSYLPNKGTFDQDVITKYAERFEFFEGLISFVRTGNPESVYSWCKNCKFEAKDFDEFKFDEAGNSFLHFLVSDWVSEFSVFPYYFLGYDRCQKDLKGNDYLESVKKCIRYLKERYKFNLEKTNNEGLTVMHTAAACDRLVFIKVFFDLDEKLLELKHSRGKTPLLFAAHEGKIESIKLLLLLGANIKAKDVRGWNILHVLIRGKKNECLKTLIRWLIDFKKKKVVSDLLNDRDNSGNVPCDYAEKEVRKWLFK